MIVTQPATQIEIVEGIDQSHIEDALRITKTMSGFWVRLATASNSAHQMQKPLTPNDG